MTTLFTHIHTLVNVREDIHLLRSKELQQLPCLHNAYLLVEDEVIADYGTMDAIPENLLQIPNQVNVSGKMILPGWCDSHTHLVFAGSREDEFIAKIKGFSYADIAAQGGGISATAKKVNQLSEDALYHISYQRLQEVIALGTTAIEIKSGYGLTVEGELKMLRVIKRLQQTSRIPIKPTFLGAHTIPVEYKNNRQGYIDVIINEMLPAIAAERLADYIDVFCEQGFFTPEETAIICGAGLAYGFKPKIHANQLHLSGGIETGVQLNAISVDHLECVDAAAISTLAPSNTIGTLLPTAAFFLRMPLQPARKLIDAGCAIALASDYNPGSSPSGNMNFVVALSCIQMQLLPEEAINAATINGAFAMELQHQTGSITMGKDASFIITKPIPSIAYLPYAFGNNHIDKVMLKGEWV